MEDKGVNILKSMQIEVKNRVVVHRPPSGKPKNIHGTSSNIRNRRLRMPLPPQENIEGYKEDQDRSCQSSPVNSGSTKQFINNQRPHSANAALVTCPNTTQANEGREKKIDKVNFSSTVEVFNPSANVIPSRLSIKNLQLDLVEPPKKTSRKNSLQTVCDSESGTRSSKDPVILARFLVSTAKPKPDMPVRPYSATTYKQSADMIHSIKRRPASASVKRRSSAPNCGLRSDVDNESSELEPFVYGLKSNEIMCGSETDLSSHTEEFSPYKMSVPPVFHPEKEAQGGDQKDDGKKCPRDMPETLKPLAPWLTDGLPRHWTGIDSSNCLMFLPSLSQRWEDLPVVPAPHGPMDELPYTEVVLPKETWNPKKYSHPSFSKIPEWKCQHSKTEVRLYNRDGILLYERYQGTRTQNVVRKEIAELENLLKGIGTDGSDCMVVQIQADITRLRKMVDDTLKLADNEVFKRPVSPEPPDTFGLKKFYQEHDDIMKEIKRQHKICIQELALLENKMELDEGLKHFNKVVAFMEIDAT